MNLVDSSGWLEYFSDGPSASAFAASIEDVATLVVPAVVIYEVYKRILQQRDDGDAIYALAAMQMGNVVELTQPIAVLAARLSVSLKLPMADAMILATAQTYEATLWTQDAHFEGLDLVHYVKQPDL